MNVFYEESGAFKVGAVLVDNTTSLQIEAAHGKRSKIKASAIRLRFETPPLTEFMGHVQLLLADLDADFLWECCQSSAEFSSNTLAADYFGHSPKPVESAAILTLLHSAPMYFYKKGRGNYKAAPPEALKAALASQERKRLQAEIQARYVEQLCTFTLPEEFKPMLPDLLYSPDKGSTEWKAVDAACAKTKLSFLKILEKCNAIPSSHDFHLNQFLHEHFPGGTGFGDIDPTIDVDDSINLPVADVCAFSIDDATTTEIDDAFSVTPMKFGGFRVGIHIAAPALGITAQSALDKIAVERLSTVYLPGKKITMLPEFLIKHYTLKEKHLCPAISLYLEVADDYTVTGTTSRIEKINITANLRHDDLAKHFNETTLSENKLDYPFAKELKMLWHFAGKLEEVRGKANDTHQDKVDFHFEITNDRVTIHERRRGSPIDKLVSELMIYVNTEWGKQLANANIAGIYRSQGGGKVVMSTSAAPHQGLGVSQYAWSSSPMRRYVDLINQRQLIAMLRDETPPYTKESDDLLIPMRDFDIAYGIYNDFQRLMERYWCLRWLIQENISTISAQVIKENLVRFEGLPFVVRVPSLSEIPPGTYVELEISQIDLLERNLNAKFLHKQEA